MIDRAASNITPGFNKQNALISINALVDIDVGLYNLIKEQYLDPNVFDENLLNNLSTLDIIRMTYNRKEDNPLYAISHIQDKKLLDDYYMEFLETQYKEIYDRSVYTDILHLIFLLLDSNEINVSILYYSDYAKEKLEEDIKNGTLPSKISLISVKELPRKVDSFNELYFRSVFECNNLKPEYFKSPKAFYISTFSRNDDELGRLLKVASLDNIIRSKLFHEVFRFSLYDFEVLNNIKHENSEGEPDNE